MVFNLKNIQQNISLITEPWYAEHANLYLVKGSFATLLIDVGLGIENLSTWLHTQEFDPDFVTITHAHYDHCGGLHHFPAQHIVITPQQAKNIQQKELWALDYLSPKDFDEDGEEVVLKFKTTVPHTQISQQSFDLGDRKLEIIPLPGHTDDSTILYDRTQRLLFTGDTLYNGTPYYSMKNSSISDFITSLEYIQRLDFTTVFPGHSEVLLRSQALKIIERWLRELRTQN